MKHTHFRGRRRALASQPAGAPAPSLDDRQYTPPRYTHRYGSMGMPCRLILGGGGAAPGTVPAPAQKSFLLPSLWQPGIRAHPSTMLTIMT
jgi:hypothetical protein